MGQTTLKLGAPTYAIVDPRGHVIVGSLAYNEPGAWWRGMGAVSDQRIDDYRKKGYKAVKITVVEYGE